MKTIERNNLNKKEISKEVSLKTGLPFTYIYKILENIFELIILELKKSKIVKIKNFGTFKLLSKKSRTGRNPINKKEYLISSRNSVVFKTSKNLMNKINPNI
tara:strand:+ start:253 stop:558 length:306 start_codon:yes stop_codon:yes gene_type:complete